MDYTTPTHSTAGGLAESAGPMYMNTFPSDLDPNISWLALEEFRYPPFVDPPRSLTALSASSDEQTPPRKQWTFVPSGSLVHQQEKSAFDLRQASNLASAKLTPSTQLSTGEPSRASRRQRNTEAARRYRQRKVDRVNELEEALTSVSKERDELKLKLARAEAEAELLRKLVAGKS